jgi:hypothetical protein
MNNIDSLKYCFAIMIMSCIVVGFDADMTSPSVKVNTLFKQNERPFIDGFSKFFVTLECFLGLNRLPLLINKWRFIVTTIVVLYSIFVIFLLIYITRLHFVITFLMIVNFTKYIFCICFSFVTWKRMEKFYCELSRFDTEIGCRPKTAGDSIRNAVASGLFNIFIIIFDGLCYYYNRFFDVFITIIPLHLIHSLEMFFYGHLLSLITPRLRLINYYVESALSVGKDITQPKINKLAFFKHKNSKNYEMTKLMDMYHIVIKAYDSLIDALKWQVV